VFVTEIVTCCDSRVAVQVDLIALVAVTVVSERVEYVSDWAAGRSYPVYRYDSHFVDEFDLLLSSLAVSLPEP